MDFSIIISTRNRAESLARTLDAFHAVEIPDGAKAEILVVDNASTDKTPAVAQSGHLGCFTLRYLLEPTPGKMHAQNRGLAAAQGTVLLTTDDDVVPSKDWLVRMTGPLIRREFDALVGRIELAPYLMRPWMTDMHKHSLAAPRAGSVDKVELIGANMAFHRCVLERVPEFDTELGPGALGFADDTLFSMQLYQAGFRIDEAPHALVTHHLEAHRLRRGDWLAAAEKMGRSHAYVSYHWWHKTVTRPYVRFCHVFAQYYFWRTMKRGECSTEEGIPLWEFIVLQRLHRLRYYLALRDRWRNYDKQGLIKRHPS